MRAGADQGYLDHTVDLRTRGGGGCDGQAWALHPIDPAIHPINQSHCITDYMVHHTTLCTPRLLLPVWALQYPMQAVFEDGRVAARLVSDRSVESMLRFNNSSAMEYLFS